MSAVSILLIGLLVIRGAITAPQNHPDFLIEYQDSIENGKDLLLSTMVPSPSPTTTAASAPTDNLSTLSSANDLSEPGTSSTIDQSEDVKNLVTLGEALAIMDKMSGNKTKPKIEETTYSEATSENLENGKHLVTLGEALAIMDSLNKDKIHANEAEPEMEKTTNTKTTFATLEEVNAPETTPLTDITTSPPAIMPPLVFPTLFGQVGHIYDAIMAKAPETVTVPGDVTAHGSTGTPSLILTSTPECDYSDTNPESVPVSALPIPPPPTEPSVAADSEPLNTNANTVVISKEFEGVKASMYNNFEHHDILATPLKEEPKNSLDVKSYLAANYHDALLDESASEEKDEKSHHNHVAPTYQPTYVFVVKIPIMVHTLRKDGGIDGDGAVTGYVPIVVSMPGISTPANVTVNLVEEHVPEKV